MNSKTKALLEVSLYYIIIGLIGWKTFMLTADQESIWRFFYADLAMTVLTFLFSILRKNSSTYDAYWSVIPFYFVLAWYVYFDGAVWGWPQWLTAFAISFWSWRLTISWAIGWPGWIHEDWRYVNFRNQFGKFFQPINFLAIHLYPTVIVFLGMLGLFWVFEIGVLDNELLLILGAAIAILGTLLEFFADRELMKFRNRANKKKSDILRTGLWAYSRNPNYLGEILFWIGLMFMGFAFGAPWYAAIGAAGMLLMFLFASIPMKNKQMAKNRPEAFAKYKAEVSALFPLPPKNK